MMPLLAIIRIRHAHGGFTLWAPLVLLWLLVAVLGLVLSPLLALGAWVGRRNPAALASGFWALVFASKGTVVEVVSPAASVLVRLV